MSEREQISPCIELGCSACCQNISISLHPKEAEFLREAGTELVKEIGVPSGGWEPSSCRDTYHLKGHCGHLGDDGLCQVYNDPRRPSVCALLKPGPGFLGINGCNSIRIENGLRPLRKDGSLRE